MQENYVSQKSRRREKKIREHILTTAVLILQATEVPLSAKTLMPFYGFKREEKGMPITMVNS